jgi:hypothetical protein
MSPPSIQRIVEGGAAALIVALTIGAFATAGVVNMTAAIIMLVIASIVGIGTIWFSDSFQVENQQWSRRARTLISVVFLVCIFGIGGCINFLRPVESANGADISIEKVELEHYPGYQEFYTFSYFYRNIGKMRASTPLYNAAWEVFDHLPTKEEIDLMVNGIISESYNIAVPDSIQSAVQPQHGQFNTIWDIVIDDKIANKVIDRKAWLAIFIFLKYIDDATDGGYIVTERCGWFIGTFDFQQWCLDHNLSYRVPSKGHPFVFPPTPKPLGKPTKK